MVQSSNNQKEIENRVLVMVVQPLVVTLWRYFRLIQQGALRISCWRDYTPNTRRGIPMEEVENVAREKGDWVSLFSQQNKPNNTLLRLF